MTAKHTRKINIRRAFKKFRLSSLLVGILISLVLAFSMLPLVYLICTAFKPLDELLKFPPQFLVYKPTTQNFSNLVTALSASSVPFLRYLFNSVFVTVITVFLTVIVSSLGAYGLVVFAPGGSKLIINVVIAALMFSVFVTQIPTYIIVVNMGLYNHYLSLILPKIAVGYNFFLMERFTRQIPRQLIEAGRIDGASHFSIFWKIVMPMLRPAWSTLVVLSFTSIWNDSFSPLVFISKQAMKTLPIALQTIAGGTGSSNLSRAGATMAAALITTAPTIVLFVLMQRKVMQTMAFSGIK